jgi:hypothetical protein
MAIFNKDNFILTGTYSGTQTIDYEFRLYPASYGDPSAKSTFKYRMSNINRNLFLKFTHNSTTVVVRRNIEDSYIDHPDGLPLFIGDSIYEITGKQDVASSSFIGTIASITSGTEGVNVKQFTLASQPTWSFGSGTLDAQVEYRANLTSSLDLEDYTTSSSQFTNAKLYGLSFYYTGTLNANNPHNPGAGNEYYEIITFTGYADNGFSADKMAKVFKDGKCDIIGWNKSDNRFRQRKNIYSDGIVNPNQVELSNLLEEFSVSDKPDFVSRGDDLYIGTGKNSLPLFLGHPNITQFGKKISDETIFTTGPTLVNTSIIPSLEQFVLPNSSGNNMLNANITNSSWALSGASQTIIGYQNKSGYLLKATKNNGVSKSVYCGGVIQAIRLDYVESDKVWVLVNKVTSYRVLFIDTADMSIDSNRVYKLTGSSLPSASSNEVKLTDILVAHDSQVNSINIYLQASDANIDTKPIQECIFGTIESIRQSYIWRSGNIYTAPTSVPIDGYTNLDCTDITPRIEGYHERKTTPNINSELDPYWYSFTSVDEQGDSGGAQFIEQGHFSSTDKPLIGDEFRVKQSLPKRGLFIWGHLYNANNSPSVALVIPYVENTVSTGDRHWAISKEYGDTIESEDSYETNYGERIKTKIKRTKAKIGPIVKLNLSYPNPSDHSATGNKNVILGSHIQIFPKTKDFVHHTANGYTGVKRIPFNVESSELNYNVEFNPDISDDTTSETFYGDGANISDFKSITTVVNNAEVMPNGIFITESSKLHYWDILQNSVSNKVDNSDNDIVDSHLYSNDISKSFFLNLNDHSLPNKTFNPSTSGAVDNPGSTTTGSAILASQDIFRNTTVSPDTIGFASVVFPNDSFNLYYLYDASNSSVSSNELFTLLDTKASIKIEVANSNIETIYDNSMLLPDKNANSNTDSDYYSKYYRLSLMYDGYQESVLDKSIYVSSTNPYKYGQKITISALPSSLNHRISHINIYRGKAYDGNSTKSDSEYLLIKSIPFDGDGWIDHSDGYLKYTLYDNVGDNFGSYEALTGISPEMNTNFLHYSISEECAGYLFVAQADNPEISNTDNYIFRSKAGKFNIFNWANEYCALPEKITALQSYNNFLYVFSPANVYTINPNNLSIVDNMQGQGVLSNEGVISTDYGMFFADKYGVYIHNGKSSQLISRTIEYTSNSDLSNFVWSAINWDNQNPELAFDSQRKALLIFFKVSNNSYAWVYSVLQKRWDLWSFDNEVRAIIQGKFGEILASDGKLFQVGTGTTRKAWEFQSKKITAGFDTYEKQFKEVHYEGTNSLSTTYKTSLADSSWNALSSNRLNSAHSKSKWLQIKVADTSGTKQLESLGVHFRPLRAKSTKV